MADPLLLDGGHSITTAPEFYYVNELHLLAAHYKDKFPGLRPTTRDGNAESALADDSDFAAALRAKRINPPDPDLAARQNTAVRTFLNTAPDKAAPMPEEFDSEFHDYHSGALAYRRGDANGAQQQFEKLLARPAAERHYRTIWALYMLARIAEDAGENAKAVARCQQLRSTAAAGFADTTHCVSASLHLEARHSDELATEIHLQELARGSAKSGDFHAVGSLLNDISNEELTHRAHCQALREVTSCQLMGAASGKAYDSADNSEACARWLAAVEAAAVKNPRDADRLGWIAYFGGDYPAAARWLKLVTRPTALSSWLQAKLALRAGRSADALAAMQQCVRLLPAQEFSNGESGGVWDALVSTGRSALGDSALLQLACGNFHDSMAAFLKGKLWLDAAWVAEQLMTTAELKAAGAGALLGYDEAGVPDDFYTYRMRWLLARRLAREGHGDVGLPYFPRAIQATATDYFSSLQSARNPKLPKAERARAWQNAAWLARTHGLELLGTEREPDNAATDGQFDAPPTRQIRLAGKYQEHSYLTDQPVTKPIGLPTSNLEKRRLLSIPQPHTQRWHYRITAADHAWHAAKLLPDGSEELADVLNSAGRWFFHMTYGEEMSQKFYDAIEARCPNTTLGSKVLAAKNFTLDRGPWSGPLSD